MKCSCAICMQEGANYLQCTYVVEVATGEIWN